MSVTLSEIDGTASVSVRHGLSMEDRTMTVPAVGAAGLLKI
jgi:hypothetical protein